MKTFSHEMYNFWKMARSCDDIFALNQLVLFLLLTSSMPHKAVVSDSTSGQTDSFTKYICSLKNVSKLLK
jgi:hypothetical protein